MYGLYTTADIRQLWVKLRSLVENAGFPYIIIGDFNAIYQATDRINGALVSQAETIDFSEFIIDVGVMQAPCTGAYYSWSNKAIGERISSRIDRAFINNELLLKYPYVLVKYLTEGISDHTPLVITFCTGQEEGGRSFRFNNILAKDVNYLETVRMAWYSTGDHFKLKIV